MASARRLSTAELGANRYSTALSTHLWPVEVKLPRGTSGRNHLLHVPGQPPVTFRRDVVGGFRASLAVPEGSMTYEIRNHEQLVSTGALEVHAPEPPLKADKSVGNLSSRPESGADQLSKEEAEKIDGWPIQFFYHEETWAAREVMVVCDDLDLEIPLERHPDGSFRGNAVVEEGQFMYRFCVTPREATRADQAPYTRLGWDDMESTPMSLMTWPLQLQVNDLGKTGGKGVVPTKIGGALARKKSVGTSSLDLGVEQQTNLQPKEKHNGKGTLLGAFLAIATVACAFGASITLLLIARGDGQSDTETSTVSSNDTDRVSSSADKTQHDVLRHARSQGL